MNTEVSRVRLGTFDTLALAGISFLLLDAFYFQLVEGELPCAFCNLIRVAFMVFGSGFLLNLNFRRSQWNYVLSAFGALVGSMISLLFMFAKAPPTTHPTGSAIFGLHMYTWTFLVFTAAIMYCLILTAFFVNSADASEPENAAISRWVAILFVSLVVANLTSSFLQNGFGTFKAGGQQHYQMLYDGDVMKP
jgi:disulfide bond formation protein DsbB